MSAVSGSKRTTAAYASNGVHDELAKLSPKYLIIVIIYEA